MNKKSYFLSLVIFIVVSLVIFLADSLVLSLFSSECRISSFSIVVFFFFRFPLLDSRILDFRVLDFSFSRSRVFHLCLLNSHLLDFRVPLPS